MARASVWSLRLRFLGFWRFEFWFFFDNDLDVYFAVWLIWAGDDEGRIDHTRLGSVWGFFVFYFTAREVFVEIRDVGFGVWSVSDFDGDVLGGDFVDEDDVLDAFADGAFLSGGVWCEAGKGVSWDLGCGDVVGGAFLDAFEDEFV